MGRGLMGLRGERIAHWQASMMWFAEHFLDQVQAAWHFMKFLRISFMGMGLAASALVAFLAAEN